MKFFNQTLHWPLKPPQNPTVTINPNSPQHFPLSSVSAMTCTDSELQKISKELDQLSFKRQQLLERKKIQCILQELRNRVESKQTGDVWKRVFKPKAWRICNTTLFMLQELTSTQVSCMHHTRKAVCSNLCNNSVDKFFACEEEAASQQEQQQQQQIDTIDDQLKKLTARKAELQNRLDNIDNAKEKNNEKGETVSPEERLTPPHSGLLTGFSSTLTEVSFTISQKIVPEVPAAVSDIFYVEPPPPYPGKIIFMWMPVKTVEFHIFCFIYCSCTTENSVWMLLRIFVQVLISHLMMLKQFNYRTKWILPSTTPPPKKQLTKQKKIMIEGEHFHFYFFPQQPRLWFWTWKNFHHVQAGHSVQSAGSSSRPRPFPPSAVSLGWSASWQP